MEDNIRISSPAIQHATPAATKIISYPPVKAVCLDLLQFFYQTNFQSFLNGFHCCDDVVKTNGLFKDFPEISGLKVIRVHHRHKRQSKTAWTPDIFYRFDIVPLDQGLP